MARLRLNVFLNARLVGRLSKAASGAVVEDAMDELQERVPVALDQVAAKLPADFPRQLRQSIFSGVEERLNARA